MKVRDIMTTQVNWAAPGTPLDEVARMMKNEDIGSVPICEGNQLLGIVTDRDIVIRAVAEGKTVNNTYAESIMSKNVRTVSSDADAHDVSAIMSREQIRRLPVVDQGKLVGIVALGDLAVEQIHVDEAGEALSDISHGVHH